MTSSLLCSMCSKGICSSAASHVLRSGETNISMRALRRSGCDGSQPGIRLTSAWISVMPWKRSCAACALVGALVSGTAGGAVGAMGTAGAARAVAIGTGGCAVAGCSPPGDAPVAVEGGTTAGADTVGDETAGAETAETAADVPSAGTRPPATSKVLASSVGACRASSSLTLHPSGCLTRERSTRKCLTSPILAKKNCTASAACRLK